MQFQEICAGGQFASECFDRRRQTGIFGTLFYIFFGQFLYLTLFCDTYFGQFASECIDTAAKLEWNDNMLMIERPALSENDKIVFTQLLEYTILLWKLPGWHKLWRADKPGPSGQLVLSWCDDQQNLKTLHVCCRNAENNLFCFEKLNFQNVCSKNLNLWTLRTKWLIKSSYEDKLQLAPAWDWLSVFLTACCTSDFDISHLMIESLSLTDKIAVWSCNIKFISHYI